MICFRLIDRLHENLWGFICVAMEVLMKLWFSLIDILRWKGKKISRNHRFWRFFLMVHSSVNFQGVGAINWSSYHPFVDAYINAKLLSINDSGSVFIPYSSPSWVCQSVNGHLKCVSRSFLRSLFLFGTRGDYSPDVKKARIPVWFLRRDNEGLGPRSKYLYS